MSRTEGINPFPTVLVWDGGGDERLPPSRLRRATSLGEGGFVGEAHARSYGVAYCHPFRLSRRREKSKGNKKSLAEGFCQGRINDYPRYHLDSRQQPCTLQGTSIPPTTDACPRVAEYSVRYHTFDCTLSGPFDRRFLTRFSAPRALCEGVPAVTSASTVCVKFGVIISPRYAVVKYCMTKT